MTCANLTYSVRVDLYIFSFVTSVSYEFRSYGVKKLRS